MKLTTEDTENTERAIDCLVYTSADDLKTQLKYFKAMGKLPSAEILNAAHSLCIKHGYKSKAKLLEGALNLIEKKEGGK